MALDLHLRGVSNVLQHFQNLTDYENIEYEDMERKEHNRYCCRLYNDIAHISERNED